MIIKLADLKPVCANIASVIDNNAMSEIATTIQLGVFDTKLKINYTNKQYFVSSKIPVTDVMNVPPFSAVIKADTFIKLISKLNDETVDIVLDDNKATLDVITATGKYTFATIDAVDAFDKQYSNFNIADDNVDVSYSIDNGVLHNIIDYSNTEFGKVPDSIAKSNVMYRMCYLDSQGSIAMSGGACIYNANVEVDNGVYLTDKLLKLLKLFNHDTQYNINIKTGTAAVLNNVVQQKIEFTSDNMEIYAILPSNTAIKLPVDKVRQMATTALPNTVNIDTNNLAQVLDRFSIFVDGTSVVDTVTLEFTADNVKVRNEALENVDVVNYINSISLEQPYVVKVCLSELLTTLNNYETAVSIDFGVNTNIVLHNEHVTNIIPCIK